MERGFREDVARIGDQLRLQALPWWVGTVDERYGGYLLAPDEKQLATQSRMIWVFAHAHHNGLGDYLGAADRGVEFLLARFRDRRHGGFYWKTDRAGRVRSDRKILYGHLFAVYGLVEYVRAGGSRDLLAEARTTFELIVDRAHDGRHGGWLEHFNRRWRPARRPRGFEVEIAGLKSANTHLHAIEALAELHAETRNGDVASILGDSIDVCTRCFFPEDPVASVQHRTRDWRRAGRPGVSHGHNVEFAWLLVHAELGLGRQPSQARFDAYVESMLAAARPVRIWWEEAELLAALATGLARWPDRRREGLVAHQLEYALTHVVDPSDGLWWEKVTADGRVVSPLKAGIWKDAFHEVRATTMLLDALVSRSGAPVQRPGSATAGHATAPDFGPDEVDGLRRRS